MRISLFLAPIVILLVGCGSSARATTESTTANPAPASAAPAPSATAQVELISHQILPTRFGGPRIVGVVENTGTAPATDIQVAISLFDDTGATIGAAKSIYTRNILPPGERSPFLIALQSSDPQSWASQKIQVQAETLRAGSFADALWSKDLVVEGDSGAMVNQFGTARYQVTGQVRNDGDKTANLVLVLVALYDADGAVLGINQSVTKLDEIAPGMRAPFSVEIDTTAAPASYEVFVQGAKKA